jgi:hypothetical protein
MLISLAAATRTWTEDKISVLALKVFTQAEGQQNEILTIKHPSSPDKAVKIPLRSVNNIDLIMVGRTIGFIELSGSSRHFCNVMNWRTSYSGPVRPHLLYFGSKCNSRADSSLSYLVHSLFIYPNTMIQMPRNCGVIFKSSI